MIQNHQPDEAMRATDEHWMRVALQQAQLAADADEVPVGAVVVCDGQLVAAAHNRRELDRMATAHAELLAIEQACRIKGSWRLSDCTLYVTLEPCPMCAGAIVNARVGRVVYGARDAKAGAFGSVLQMNEYPLNHKPILTREVLQKDCAAVLSDFFMKKRK